MYVPRKDSDQRTHHGCLKVPKFSNARKICCNQPELLIKRPKHRVINPKDELERQTVKMLSRLIVCLDLSLCRTEYGILFPHSFYIEGTDQTELCRQRRLRLILVRRRG